MINAVGNRMTREIARQGKLADALERTQIQLSTGKRIQRMSDDPVAARRILTIGTTQASMTSWQANIKSAQAQVAQASDVLGSTSDMLARARELTLSAASGTMSPTDLATIAAELNAIADEIDGLAATRDSNGEPLFAAGNARVVRFDSDVSFAPVQSAASAFVVGGNALSTGLRDAATAVAAGNQAGIDAALTNITGAISHIADQNAALGLSAGRLERIGDSLSSRGIEIADERQSVEEVDLQTAIAQLNAQDLTLNAAQAAFAKINRQTLFDLLN
ncbi:flagellin [Sphingopyxis sp.]|uniref:flagellin N-terminal helical domain-containing protein n=1 Tax=Sphingopyxis sp. TaxID=1908224 RepID=UPI003BA89E77